MPPRRKGKGPARAASSPVPDDDPMVVDTPPTQHVEESPPPKHDILKDPWTDEQETSLFKGIIRWKPAGMHKHFRMIALSENLRNHGYDPSIEKHTRIPGIWEKLRTLYNLDIIDERENSFDYEDGDDKFLEFKLPEDYEDSMHMRGKRSPSDAPSSPSRLHRSPSPPGVRKRKRGDTVTQKRRASTVEDTDEPRTSPANSPTPRTARAGRSANRSVGRVKADSRSRQPSKDTTMDEAEEETEEAGEDDEEADAEEEDESASQETSKPASRRKAEPPAKTPGASRKSKRKR